MCISPDAVLTTASCVKQFLEETVGENNTPAEGEAKLDFEGVFVKILGDFDSELSISDVLYHPSVNFDMVSFEEPKYFKYFGSLSSLPFSLPPLPPSPLSSLLSPLSSLSLSLACALGSSIDTVY